MSDRVAIDVPIATRSYDAAFVQTYEQDVVRAASSRAARMAGPITLIDCGADIGLMSARFVAEITSINRVVAFEPNSSAFPTLQGNLGQLPVDALARNAAVADFDGKGELRYPEHDADSDHAAFIVRAEQGPIPVTTIDALGLPGGRDLIIKIDVEGGELAVIEGAAATIAQARNVVVMFEAHRDQVKRSGIDTCEVAKRLAAIRQFSFGVAEDASIKIDLTKPFFEQANDKIYNICASTV